MDTPQAVVVLTPPSFGLRFENWTTLHPTAVKDLKIRCPWMRWDKEAKVWCGPTAKFGQTLRFCHSIFDDDQIIILWPHSNKESTPRQLRMF